MALDSCTECGAIEGGWRKFRASEIQMVNAGFDPDDTIEQCEQCGGQECREGIPEHDDYDMER